jgi:hypothetical protein
MNDLKDKLNLNKIPHFTILQKFVSRIPSSLFNRILSKTLKFFLLTWINNLYYGSRCNRIYKFLYKLLLFPQNREATKELLGNFNINQNNKTIVLGWNISPKKYIQIKHENALIRQSNMIKKISMLCDG